MDNRQYRQIVDDYADMVYRIALNQTRRVPDAEDVVQAVFLKPYEKPPTWLECDGDPDPGRDAGHGRGRDGERTAGDGTGCDTKRTGALDERLRAWLICVTVNECKSLWRSLWRQRVELREIRDGDAPPFEEPAFAEPAHEALYAALGDLPEKCPTTLSATATSSPATWPRLSPASRPSSAPPCTCSTSRTWARARSPRCWASRNPRCAPGSSAQGSY